MISLTSQLLGHTFKIRPGAGEDTVKVWRLEISGRPVLLWSNYALFCDTTWNNVVFFFFCFKWRTNVKMHRPTWGTGEGRMY